MPPPATDVTTLSVLFVVATAAATFDAIAGGGGLMTLPALLLAGLNPVAALATNKLQSSFGTVSATVTFARRGLIQGREAWLFAVTAFLAAAIGASAAAALPKALLEALVPLALVTIAVYFALAHRPNERDVTARMSPSVFAATWCAGVGFYDGIFGPGAGAFCMIGFVTMMGCALLRATALTKLVNAGSNLGALAFFAMTGHIVWTVGLVMAAGALLGSQIGARLALRHGARLIRPLIVVVCCVLAVRLAADPANPLRHMIAGLLARMGT